MNNLPGLDAHLLAGSTDERNPAAVEEAEDEAFAKMVADASSGFADYVRDHDDLQRVFQLYHAAGGLPRMNGDPSDDAYRDALVAAFDAVLNGYRQIAQKTYTFRFLASNIYEAKEAEAREDTGYED